MFFLLPFYPYTYNTHQNHLLQCFHVLRFYTELQTLQSKPIFHRSHSCDFLNPIKNHFHCKLQVFPKQQADLVNQFMTTQDPAQRQQLLQQFGPLDNEGQQLAQRLKVLISSGGGPISLFASAAFTVTGMNLLRNGLVRLGIGGDQGSVEGVF